LLEAFLPPTNAAGPSVLTLDPARAPASSAAQTNYWELLHQAKAALKAKRWHEAKGPLQKILEHYPVATGADGAYALLAAAHRGLNETNHERAVLTKRAALEDAAPDVYLRLMELDAAAQDWAAARLNAERLLAVNPLIPQPYRYLARATEALGDRTTALQACQRLLLLDPPDPVEVHYRLARLLQQEGEVAAAKRHTLRALEEAPRFRDAQRLLLELAGGATSRVESGPAREGRP
jgi:tetratricopeptide (TPR) repeat protein